MDTRCCYAVAEKIKITADDLAHLFSDLQRISIYLSLGFAAREIGAF